MASLRCNRSNIRSLLLLFIILPFLTPLSSIRALEFENIDSFDVHPDNRWIETGTGITVSVDDSILDISDTGDGSVDTYTMSRMLRDYEGSIEIRWKMTVAGANGTASDHLKFKLLGDEDVDYFVNLVFRNYDIDGTGDVFFEFDDTSDVYRTTSLTTGEKALLTEGAWYVLRIDYDILRSDFRYRIYSDAGAVLVSYYAYEIFGNYDSNMGQANELSLKIDLSVYTSSYVMHTYIDYIEAPFEEREWTNVGNPADADWIEEDTWEFCQAQDDISHEFQHWRLIVPRLDLVSAMLRLSVSDASNFGVGEQVYIQFRIYCVDADDGDLHEAFHFGIAIAKDGTGILYNVDIYVDGIAKISSTNYFDTDEVWLSFAVGAKEQRALLSAAASWGWDPTDSSATGDEVADIYTSAVATVPSQEFVLHTTYYADFAGDVDVDYWVENFDLIYRDSFAGIDMREELDLQPDKYYDDATGILENAFGWVNDLIQGIVNGLGLIFSAVGTLISAAIEALEPLLTAVTSAVDGLITYIQSIASDFFNVLIDGAGTLFEAILDAAIILTDTITEAFFLIFWDSWSGPDILALIDWGLVSLIEIITNLPAFLTDLANQLQVLWDLLSIIGVIFFFIIPLSAGGNVGEFLEKSLGYMAVDLTMGFSILGVHIPVPSFALWLVVLQFNILDGTAFAGFLTW